MSPLASPINNAASTLASNYTAASGSLVLATGTGSRFGTPTSDAPIRITVAAKSTLVNAQIVPTTTRTIFLVTGRTGDTLTGISLASGENTPAWTNADHNYAQGDQVASLITAGTIGDIHAAISPTAVNSQANTPILPVECWGDDLTTGDGSTNEPATAFPAQLQGLTGRVIVNHGYSGAESDAILGRMQSLPLTWSHPAIIWSGRNDITGLIDQSVTLANIASMVALLTGVGATDYVILSITNADNEPSGSDAYNRIIARNNAIAAAHPGHYLDLRAHLVSLYNPNIPQDVTDHGNDVPPSSLRFNGIHFNDAGYLAIATYLQANCPFSLAATVDPILTTTNGPALFTSPFGFAPGAGVASTCPAGAVFHVGPNGTLGADAGLTYTGALAIGNNSGGATQDGLTVNYGSNSAIFVNGANFPSINVTSTTNNVTVKVQALTSSAIVGTQSAHPFSFYTNNLARVTIDEAGNVVLSPAALATTATDGFTYLPTCAGTPTGVPTAKAGTAAMVYDTTGKHLWIYNGSAWESH